MKRFLVPALILGFFSTSAFVGCDQKTEEKTTKQTDTPGGSVKEKEVKTIEKSGDKKD